MITELTIDILQDLNEKGITFLFALYGDDPDSPEWTPMIVPLHECTWIDDDDLILTIEEALKLPEEILLNHTIILPEHL